MSKTKVMLKAVALAEPFAKNREQLRPWPPTAEADTTLRAKVDAGKPPRRFGG